MRNCESSSIAQSVSIVSTYPFHFFQFRSIVKIILQLISTGIAPWHTPASLLLHNRGLVGRDFAASAKAAVSFAPAAVPSKVSSLESAARKPHQILKSHKIRATSDDVIEIKRPLATTNVTLLLSNVYIPIAAVRCAWGLFSAIGDVCFRDSTLTLYWSRVDLASAPIPINSR